MAHNAERDMAALTRIIADVARPTERLILKRDINGLMDETVNRMHGDGLLYGEAVREFKKRFLLNVLADCGGNQGQAARLLQMHRNTLHRTIKELQLDLRTLRPMRKKAPHGA